jgi:hypothetical protein
MASSCFAGNITASYPGEEIRSHYWNDGRSPTKLSATMGGLSNNRNATEDTIHPIKFHATNLPRSDGMDELLSIIYGLSIPQQATSLG